MFHYVYKLVDECCDTEQVASNRLLKGLILNTAAATWNGVNKTKPNTSRCSGWIGWDCIYRLYVLQKLLYSLLFHNDGYYERLKTQCRTVSDRSLKRNDSITGLYKKKNKQDKTATKTQPDGADQDAVNEKPTPLYSTCQKRKCSIAQ